MKSGTRTAGLAVSPRAISAEGEIVDRWMDALLKMCGVGGRVEEDRNNLIGLSDSQERYENRMDITWLTDRIGVGGGIWTADNMAKVAREGVTHIIDMQIEFDDTPLGEQCGITVLWNPTDDDFMPKPPELLQRGVDFAKAALDGVGNRVLIHCAAGVHRAPMMTLAVLASMGWELEDGMNLIESRRPVADFADVYVKSVENFLAGVEKK